MVPVQGAGLVSDLQGATRIRKEGAPVMPHMCINFTLYLIRSPSSLIKTTLVILHNNSSSFLVAILASSALSLFFSLSSQQWFAHYLHGACAAPLVATESFLKAERKEGPVGADAKRRKAMLNWLRDR